MVGVSVLRLVRKQLILWFTYTTYSPAVHVLIRLMRFNVVRVFSLSLMVQEFEMDDTAQLLFSIL